MASDQEKTRSNYMVPSSTEGYSCFSDQTTTHLVRPLQSFQYQHQSNSPTQLYTLNTTMEMLNFPPNTKNLETNSVFWKGFYDGKATGDNHHHDGGGSSSSSKAGVAINEPPRSHDFYQDDEFNTKGSSFTSESNFMQVDNRLLVEDQHDPSNMRSYHVFPCGANERPSQGLSLSLSSNNPSTIGLQSFELRHDQDHHDHDQMRLDHIPSSSSRDHEFFGPKSMMQYHQHQESTSQFQIESSKYLSPVQELLNEFCSLGTSHNHHLESKIQKNQKFNQWNQEDDDQNIAATSSSFNKHSLYSLEFLELQKRKTKLLQMLGEVDRRYKHYCDQMKGVVCSFEAVAGSGTATVYSALVSKTMSKHFRCLRDGIVGEIKATKKAMGEKDTASPGGTRGETPRLRVLDQTLRQQRAFQQMNMMETHPWRPQRGLPERSVTVLRAWLFEHFLHPYPSDVDKHMLSRLTGLSRSQVSNWFINARVRLWKPMVEEMYLEETKEHENNINSPDHGFTNVDEDNASHLFNHINSQQLQTEDKKPTQDQLVRIDSECLSSIINHPDKNDTKHFQDNLHHHHHQPSPQHHSFSRISDTFGAVELDFASYNHQNNFSSTGDRGVSLTLGLQQNRGMAFSSTSQTSLNYYPRDEIEDCQQVQYSSLLDAGEAQNLPYRNLMGAQLLHDLAG